MARWATARPTAVAAAALAVAPLSEPLSSPSTVDAAATVRPCESSITWAVMWCRLRKTASRGRAWAPSTRLRTRRWRLSRAARRSCLVYIALLALPGLAGLARLAAQLLAAVEHALALVGL